MVFVQSAVMPCPWDGSFFWGFESICARSHVLRHFVRAFPIGREFIMLAWSRYVLSSSNDQVAYIDGREFYRTVVELRYGACKVPL